MNKIFLATIVALLMSTVVMTPAFGQDKGQETPIQQSSSGNRVIAVKHHGWNGGYPGESNFGSIKVLSAIEHEGETLRLVSMTLEDLNLTEEDRIKDILQMAGYLGLRPFDQETTRKVDAKMSMLSGGHKTYIVSHPFTTDSLRAEVLYLSYISHGKKCLVPIGDVHRGAYMNIRWFYKDGDRFLFLKAIHPPKP